MLARVTRSVRSALSVVLLVVAGAGAYLLGTSLRPGPEPGEAPEDAAYYVAADVSRLDAYQLKGDAICILERDGSLRELSEAGGATAVGALAGVVEKPYVCVPKEVAVPTAL